MQNHRPHRPQQQHFRNDKPAFSKTHHENRQFLWTMRSQPSDVQKKIRREGKVVLHNVPKGTTEDEVKELLTSCVGELEFKSVFILCPKNPNKRNIITTLVFVQLEDDDAADRVISFYHHHKVEACTEGYKYTNKKGLHSELYFEYCYDKPRKGSTNTNENNREGPLSPDENITLEDIDKEIEIIKGERGDILASIFGLEQMLKQKIPELFVSEFELNELRKEDLELSEKIKVHVSQLEAANMCLQGVKEDIDQLEQLSDDEWSDDMLLQ